MACVLAPPSAWGQEPTTSLSKFAPRETKFFAELHYLGQLRKNLDESGAWNALMVLISRPGSRDSAPDELARRIETVLGIRLDEAIGTLFGEHVAVAAPDWDRLGAGVVLARIKSSNQIEQLLRGRGRRRKPRGVANVYQLGKQLSVATDGRIVVFGSPGMEGRFFEASTRLLFGEGGASLADSPAFVEQLAELPAGYLGLLYGQMPDVTSGAPNAAGDKPSESLPTWWPATWPTLRRAAAGLYASGDGKGVDLALRGQVNDPQPVRVIGGVSPSLLLHLPRSTLVAWCFSLDYLSAYKRTLRSRRGGELDEKRLLLELIRTWLHNQSLEEKLLRHLSHETVVVLGQKAAPPEKLGEQFDRPLLSVMVKVKNADAVLEGVGGIMNALVSIQNLQTAANRMERGTKRPNVPLLTIPNEVYKDVMIWRVPWGEVLRERFRCPFLSMLQVSWAVFDDWLVLSTDPVHIKQLIDASHGEPGAGFASTAAFRAVSGQDESISLVASQPAEGARLIQSWIDYLERSHPEVLEPNWWQQVFQGPRVTLGVGIKKDPIEEGVLLVDHVVDGMPAAGVLRRGDRIEAIDGRTLDLKDPLKSYRTQMANRGNPEEVTVRIRRGGQKRDLKIKIPGARPERSSFDPVRALRDLMVIGGPFSAWGYSVSGHQPEKFDAQMFLRFRQPEGPIAVRGDGPAIQNEPDRKQLRLDPLRSPPVGRKSGPDR